MAVFDLKRKLITLKVVYYGCAKGGKTTNLITLHRLTDPGGRRGLVSIATKDDRTLFFDLLPIDLGQIGGLTVTIKAYTVPGQVHYETTRRRVLAGTDGVVQVIDSSPEIQQGNVWALENLRHNLTANGLDPKTLPLVLQWNKRDLPDAVPVAKLAADYNQRQLPAFESVATTGAGVLETFGSVVKGAVVRACEKAGKKCVSGDEIDERITRALDAARSQVPPAPEADRSGFDHRFDQDSYRNDWAERGRDRQIVDEETLLGEAVQTGMELAEKLDGLRGVQETGQRQERMIETLSLLSAAVMDPAGPALPPGSMARLLRACARSRGSILLFKVGRDVMEEWEVVPGGGDPLNQTVAPSLGSAAYRLGQGEKPRYVDDLIGEVFFEALPPQASDLCSCLLVPLSCDGLKFGTLVIYSSTDERPIEETERAFWLTASIVIASSLHWRGLRRKLTRGKSPARASTSTTRR